MKLHASWTWSLTSLTMPVICFPLDFSFNVDELHASKTTIPPKELIPIIPSKGTCKDRCSSICPWLIFVVGKMLQLLQPLQQTHLPELRGKPFTSCPRFLSSSLLLCVHPSAQQQHRDALPWRGPPHSTHESCFLIFQVNTFHNPGHTNSVPYLRKSFVLHFDPLV